MSITGSFNGWNIVGMPTTPGFTQFELSGTDSVASLTSPFTMTTQKQLWVGADLWHGRLSLPPMKRPLAAPWVAFLMQLQGTLNVFQLGDPVSQHPQGSMRGTPVLAGVQPAGVSTLVTRGWLPNTPHVLLPGDHIQIGYRLHMCLDVVGSDLGGNATFAIWPSVREATPDATLVILNKPRGLFRLATNDRGWTTNAAHVFAVGFSFVEAR